MEPESLAVASHLVWKAMDTGKCKLKGSLCSGPLDDSRRAMRYHKSEGCIRGVVARGGHREEVPLELDFEGRLSLKEVEKRMMALPSRRKENPKACLGIVRQPILPGTHP